MRTTRHGVSTVWQDEDRNYDTLVVQMDYMFIAPDGTIAATPEKNSIPVLVAVDDRGAVEACYCTKKGPTDAYAIKVMPKYMETLGVKKLTLQTDGELPIQAVAKHIAKDTVPVVTLRTTPRYSSQSN